MSDYYLMLALVIAIVFSSGMLYGKLSMQEKLEEAQQNYADCARVCRSEQGHTIPCPKETALE